MMKRMAVVCALVVPAGLIAVPALSAAPPVKVAKGKITAIDGARVTIDLEGDRPDWIKKNGPVKFKVGPGKILQVSAADATPFTIVVSTKKAGEMKVGEVVTLEKGLATSGC